MSQAARNIHRETQEALRTGRSNGARLAGIIFLLLVIGIMFLAGLVVVTWMNDASRLPLSKLAVTGKIHYTTDDDIRQAILSAGPPGTFMSQDVDIIRQQIARLPWIKQVSVRKQWPDEIKVHLVEYTPVARWNDVHALDAEGNVFALPASDFGKETLPMLYGPEGTEKDVLEGYQQINPLLVSGKIKLKAATMTARHSWQLLTGEDVRVELGREDNHKRLQRFIELWPVLQRQAVAGSERVASVDLRYDSGAAVGWAPAFIEPQDHNQQRQPGTG